QTISGAGNISANGGAGELPDGGGGGGGRIAIYYVTNNFTGSISAFGGAGANYGGAGTIYKRSTNDLTGQLFIINGGKSGTNSLFSTTTVDSLTISGGAIAQAQSSFIGISNLFVGSNSSLATPDSQPLIVIVNGDATIESNGV